MNRTVEVVLKPEEAFQPDIFTHAIRRQLGLGDDVVVQPLRRSIDARGRNVVVRFLVELIPPGKAGSPMSDISYRDVTQATSRVIIVGAGPAGLFAALRLIESGVKPVILERGKDVQSRRRDLAAINQDQLVNPESNYCFGEGGAGTYSDGKLYTRSKKRGDVNRILDILVAHGAPAEIRYDAHPHIGTNKLPRVVAALRETILQYGGEIWFNTKVTDLAMAGNELTGVVTSSGDTLSGDAVILATGHSARDVFTLLHRRKIPIEAKPFALGVRVEHSQQFIDSVQYHCGSDRGPFLPASSYSLVQQVKGNGKQRGVFSFCMCPGGFIVPAATSPGEVVVNGMSPSRRDSRFANSGIVVEVGIGDLKDYENHGPLAGMYFQSDVEQRACAVAGGTQRAPAQRLGDFVKGKLSPVLLDTSYQPGLVSAELRNVLPGFVSDALIAAFRNFDDRMKGYVSNEAQIVGVESRTSSPVTIPRDRETREHVTLRRLFPCGEGAGYAGGIVSAAMDGERCAEGAITCYDL